MDWIAPPFGSIVAAAVAPVPVGSVIVTVGLV